MLEKPQDRLKRLAARPTEQELQKFMDEAISQVPIKFHYSWKEEATDSFLMLSVCSQFRAPDPSADPASKVPSCHWRLFNTHGPDAQEIWSHITFDAGQVLAFIVEAIEKINAKMPDGQTQVKATYPNRKRRAQVDPLASTFDNLTVRRDEALLAPDEFFKGNLKLVNLSTLLQSISLGRLSGRLRVQRNPIWADLYFVQGVPVHAEGTRGTGEDCLLQVICWKDGEFHFEPKIKTDEKTIQRSLDALVLEGALLLDHTDFLREAGVKLASVLYRPNPQLSEFEFDRITANERLDIVLLKRTYLSIDGIRTLEDIIDSLGLLRSQWVPLFSTLVRLGLVDIAALHESGLSPSSNREFDLSLAESARKNLLNPETDIYNYGSLLFLLSEHVRFRGETPVSLLILNLHLAKNTNSDGPAPELIKAVAAKIASQPSFNGIIGHYGTEDIAIVLPGLHSGKSAKVAERVLQALADPEFSATDESELRVSIGVACLPDDARDVGTLLGECEKAKERACKSRAGVWLAKTPTLQ